MYILVLCPFLMLSVIKMAVVAKIKSQRENRYTYDWFIINRSQYLLIYAPHMPTSSQAHTQKILKLFTLLHTMYRDYYECMYSYVR